jgi:predicted dehydrogenase
MAGDRDRWPFRIVGTAGEVTAANFVQPHVDDRVLVSSGQGDRVEHLGTRSSYTYQLEALRAHLRDGAPLPVGPDDPVDTMALIDACYHAAGLTPRPRGTLRGGPVDAPNLRAPSPR